MRKIIALILLLTILLLPGCAKGIFSSPPERQVSFTSNVKITLADKTFSGTLECVSPGNMRLTFSEPTGIEGFSVLFNGNDYVCDVMGIEDIIPAEITKDSSCIRLFFNGLSSALFYDGEFSENAAGDFNAQFQNGKYKAVFHNNGMIKQLYSDAFSFSANFFSTDL